MTRAFVALGSNLDEPVAQIRAAFAALATLEGCRIVKTSSLYRTAPIGYLDQADFINAAVELDCALTPHRLLQGLLAIESDFGRLRTFRNAPRVLDLDLLWFEGIRLDDETLTLPHPRLHLRSFVLTPLCEIAPDLTVGELGRVDHLLARLEDQGVVRLTE
ncbi:2-amino-4-hydroxy-6-hydroxymethyldihydropteridine diphosphokinase [Paludibacterium yongneupense]|uniref:2-amino-4-hydroxy-6- hydroxymethyldihydropteridine diphosphokinase n=1 Tax=Paludibacterium yongneupense TaxID=400061 RepID=UPI000407EBE1|nr:2-amino-4-hydroxy-6-hydroxymethyldihydropteridine diphosphokinase [Paludibacterium yongneupense]